MVGFLVVSTGTRSSKLFGFEVMEVSYLQDLVVLDGVIFDLLASLIHIFLVLGHQGFGDGLTDSLSLGYMTIALHTELDVLPSKALLNQKQNRLQSHAL